MKVDNAELKSFLVKLGSRTGSPYALRGRPAWSGA